MKLSKADVLKNLEGQLEAAIVLPQFSFTLAMWLRCATALLDRFYLQTDWSDTNLVVRSSGLAEDGQKASLAGHFDSVLNVSGRSELEAAIGKVVASFDQKNIKDQIFIQPMLTDVVLSGVVFTKEPSTHSPYYVINYSQSGSTESVTSGSLNEELIYVAKCQASGTNPGWVTNLIALCAELELQFSNDSLDIEFAFDKQQKLYLFQVRPLILVNESALPIVGSLSRHQQLLERVHTTISRLSKPHPYLNGAKTLLGVMPDWNPAEIIGIRPNPLALSLYKELVTNSTWAYQRNNYGYKQLRSFPLLISLAGLPYIDVRVSFNSFVPADIPHPLAEKLVNYYIEQLQRSPEKHDKVEFDIIFSCFTLDIDKRLLVLSKVGFDKNEIAQLTNSLKKLTNNIINPNGLWTKDILKIESLPARRQTIIDSDLTSVEKVYWLLEDCKRYGTLPFAGLARAGFIAVQILKSMVSEGILSDDNYENFMRSLETVSSNMAKDKLDLSFKAFLEKYGHLRPGTYDILSPRYDQAPEKYFNGNDNHSKHQLCEDFSLSLKQLEELKTKLETQGIEHDVISLFRFIKGAIEGREYAKFVFSQSLSDAIYLVEQLGNEIGFSKDDMAYCDLSSLYKAYSSSDDIQTLMTNSIIEGKLLYRDTQTLILPPLITEADDVYCFKMPEGEPNFITLLKVVAQTCCNLDDIDNLAGKIVFIPAADPGFDWLFSHNISGLITKYGGANSHMAIRAGELGIPSVIGAGDVLYNKWMKANLLDLDAGNRKVVVLR
ncbi:PEP/pyruvate-binding domain-containing protein [Paraglaciecola sp. L3A3]|uniref:PEP/pyruvate-binding domain-containing protein n=1 Tax=Paraglaciecola sp. L3A3 TaxID=2686358 RepID=UPI00131B349B|nr:PEP/pyruvate-binding domain-containing protein [Paraglaciecola sp. L3A3]